MSFGTAVKICLSKFVTVSGRASRSEFWWFFLFYNLVSLAGFIIVIVTLDENGEGGTVWPFFVAMLILLPPMLAVTARRLHDKGITAWAVLISFVPFGSFALLILCALAGDEEENIYGPPPIRDGDTVVYTKSNIPNVRDND
ncbi:DUF805 domain-containing protein [uncultured Litoreibacter sp.]|uniref:DUF805 domain-containing protein n=1 Tax=uncultured Litoreibacter sp. TaxID=1392394 RepID=UPI00260C2397|nr:DUF805 domain-containing protein [uncultured Litoreibacter sp.]